MDWAELAKIPFLGNPLERWAISAAIFSSVFFTGWVVRNVLVIRLRKIAPLTENRVDDIVLAVLEKTRLWLFFLVGSYFALHSLDLHPKVDSGSRLAFFLILFFQIGFWISHALTFWGNSYAQKALTTDPARATTVKTLLVFARIALWIVIALLILDNWGVKVAPFVAGLGVGGVAIALAVQNILGDLFASLSIVLDKPFVIGDFITVGTEAGTVEHIGLKTTRVKSLSGEQLIFSNSDLLQSRVRNFKRMYERRILFTFGIVYETPEEKIDLVRGLVKDAVDSLGGVRLERVHLSAFGASSLDFEVVYWVADPDYLVYVDKHHRLSVKLIEIFRREGIEFAYPTQVLHIDGKLSHEQNSRA